MSNAAQNSNNKIATGMLAEYNGESATTRRFLERVPEDKLTWRPHEKSMTTGQLAFHIAALQYGVLSMGLEDESQLPDLSVNYQPKSSAEIMEQLAKSESFVLEKLPKITDEQMYKLVRVKKGDQVLMEMPRVGFIRTVLLNHGYHHRGQLGVYLRLMGVPVPWSYGPSGDEAPGH